MGPNGIVALDTQPLASPSLLADLMAAKAPPWGLAATATCRGNKNLTAEGMLHLMDVLLAMLLLRVCHVVSAVGVLNVGLTAFLRNVQKFQSQKLSNAKTPALHLI